jgi:hypothetical protein
MGRTPELERIRAGDSRLLTPMRDHAVLWNVSLVDTTPPILSLPPAITVDATSPSGVVVMLTATASDPDDTAGPVTCLPASGSLFPIGTTSVVCSSSDTHGNGASADFAVTVLSPAQIISNLITTVAANGFQQAENLLQDALRSLNGGTNALLPASAAGNLTAACNQLAAFINQVQAQAGKALSAPTASQLIQSAADARAALACP